MHFISLLLILLVLRYRRHWLAKVQNDAIFEKLFQTSPQQPLIQFLLVIVLPSLAVLFLFRYLSGSSFGFLELLLSSLILMYALGRGHFISLFKRYQQACQENNLAEIQTILQILGKESSSQSFCELHSQIKQQLAYRSLTHLFAVLFWFAVLGPVGALFYRLNHLLAAKHYNAVSCKAIELMEWPAARLFAFSVALLGNFNATIDYCKNCLSDRANSAPSITYTATQLALGLNQRDWTASRFVVEHSEEEICQMAIDETLAIQQLLRRCLALAVVGISLLHIII